jgi:hypothetical protein
MCCREPGEKVNRNDKSDAHYQTAGWIVFVVCAFFSWGPA